MNAINIPVSAGSSGTPSLSIVYSNNGKRITLSKALATRLQLTDKVQIFPLVEDNVILLAKQLPDNKGIELKLNGNDKKISYNAKAVEFIVKEFNLHYDGKTSNSFTNITFEKDGDLEIAIVHFLKSIGNGDEIANKD